MANRDRYISEVRADLSLARSPVASPRIRSTKIRLSRNQFSAARTKRRINKLYPIQPLDLFKVSNNMKKRLLSKHEQPGIKKSIHT
ncbi:unnamed protein product [Moneuplotes crassus]|uniref:Uncharacterized protein n=1 Tax=Euplotes crassus TaxID=5936 RepID=A0AAD2CZV3_EUPCR|nr:unnamed protein product [Moneuplotes crassus]